MAYTGGISRYFLRKMPSKHSRSFAFPGWEIILCKIRLSWSERADRIQLYGKAILTLTPPINIGSFSIDDGDSSENATLKMNSLFSETLSSLFLFAENVKCKRIFLALIWRPHSSLERERKIRRRLFTHVKLGIFRPTLGPQLASTGPNSQLEIMFKFPYLALTRLNSHYLAQTRPISPLPSGYQF